MSDSSDLLALKQRLSPHLMSIDGVSGVGLGADAINVYIERDDDGIRQTVTQKIQSEAPATGVNFIVSGKFSAL